MNRTRMIILGLFALVLSVIVTYFIQRELAGRLSLQKETPDSIVVAKVALNNGMLLEAAQHLTTAPWPKEMKLEGSYNDPKELEGRGVLFPIQLNEPILESKLTPKGTGAGLAPGIPEGMRAVAVQVNNVSGVAGFVLPGSRVDVILSGSPDGGRIDYSKVILENVQVLSAGQDVTYDAQGKPKTVPVITLLVTPEEAQKLSLAALDGRLQLALRNPMDQEVTNPNAVRRETLYSRASATEAPQRAELAAPARPRRPAPQPTVVIPPPPAVVEVELIEGSNRKTLKFQEKKQAGSETGEQPSN